MQIIVFLNISFDSFSCHENDLHNYHSIVKLIKRELSYQTEVRTIESIWPAIYQGFNLSNNFSPAMQVARQLKLDVQYALMATPVRVQLGLRNSQTFFVGKKQMPTDDQIDALNDYFDGEFLIYPLFNDQYLLCMNEQLDFNLDKHHWSPQLADFTLQMITADSRLRKMHTDIQAWCHQHQLPWNSLYLWGQGSEVTHELIEVKNELPQFTALQNLNPLFDSAESDFVNTETNISKKIFCVNDLGMDNPLLTKCEFHLNTNSSTCVEFIFTDNYSVKVEAHGQLMHKWKWLKSRIRRGTSNA